MRAFNGGWQPLNYVLMSGKASHDERALKHALMGGKPFRGEQVLLVHALIWSDEKVFHDGTF